MKSPMYRGLRRYGCSGHMILERHVITRYSHSPLLVAFMLLTGAHLLRADLAPGAPFIGSLVGHTTAIQETIDEKLAFITVDGGGMILPDATGTVVILPFLAVAGTLNRFDDAAQTQLSDTLIFTPNILALTTTLTFTSDAFEPGMPGDTEQYLAQNTIAGVPVGPTNTYTIISPAEPVPEPSTLLLVGCGSLLVIVGCWRSIRQCL